MVDAAKSLGVDHEADLRSKSVAERYGGTFVGYCRRDLVDHVIVFNERHLRRLMAEYIRYYHEDRTHLGLKSKLLQVVKP